MEFTYKLLENQPNSILRVEDGAIIPQGNNGDWQLFEAWLLLGNTPLPADVSLVPVREIDARRLRLALLQLDLLDTVEAAINSLGAAAKIEWEYATTIREDYSLVVALATNLSLDTEAIFSLAISLT
jgi:hypothetical protein